MNRQAAVEKLWSQIAAGASYSFCKSHSVAYGYLSYASAWYKANYPLEFFAAYVDVNRDKPDRAFMPLRLHPELFAPPGWEAIDRCEIVDGKIQIPLYLLRGLGPKVIEALAEYRPKDFKDLEERVPRGRVNKTARESLLRAGLGDTPVETYAPLLGIVLSGDPIIKKRRYYANKGYGSTIQLKRKIPGYLIEAKKKVSKKSGKTYALGTLVDEFGALEFLTDEITYDNIKEFIGSSTVITIEGSEMQGGGYWANGAKL